MAHDLVVRSFFTTGAMGAIDGPHTFVVASSAGVHHPESRAVLEALPNYLGTVQDPRPETERGTRLLTLDYRFLRRMLTVKHASRSSTMAIKLRFMAPRKRRFFRLMSSPGINAIATAAVMWRTGLNPDIERVIDEVRPDLVIIPTGVYDNLAWDALRSAKKRRIQTLALVPNWDALSGKAGFPIHPDYLGVWGEQTAEQAVRIHGFPRERVALLGAPQFESYLRYQSGDEDSPFPFRYALFAGTSAPFDELTTLSRLEQLIEDRGLPLKIVYRPHPDRKRRKQPDFVDEAGFKHIVIDPQVKDRYVERFRDNNGAKAEPPFFPSLDYYPRLLANAEFVICPFSSMIVEAALLDRFVLVPAYSDGIHRNSPDVLRKYDHFAGLEGVSTVRASASLDDLVESFDELSRGDTQHTSTVDGVRQIVYFDERSYAHRLKLFVNTILERSARIRAPYGQ